MRFFAWKDRFRHAPLPTDSLREETAIRDWPALFRFLFSGSGIWAILGGASAAALYKIVFGAWDRLDAGVILAFFLLRGIIEWGIHSWLYHANPLPLVNCRLTSAISEMHFRHHVDPLDLTTLLITWRGVVALFLATFMTSALLFQSLDRAMTMVLGLAVVGLMIELLHLVCHCRIPHRSRLIRRLVLLHRSHHYRHQNRNFGVSSSLGDILFGTLVPTEPSSLSTENLGKDIEYRRKTIRADAEKSFSQEKREQ